MSAEGMLVVTVVLWSSSWVLTPVSLWLPPHLLKITNGIGGELRSDY